MGNRLIGVLIIITLLMVYCMLITLNSPRNGTKEQSDWTVFPTGRFNERSELEYPLFRQPSWKNGTMSEGKEIDARAIVGVLHGAGDKGQKSEVFYGDCHSYSEAGIHQRDPEIIKQNDCHRRLPKAMIAGLKKCGTMTLTHYLSLHPLVAIQGEIQFPNGKELRKEDIEEWKSKMPLTSPRMFPMAGKPLGVVWRNDTAIRMVESLMQPNGKLILIIRNPVVRAVSDYVHTNTVLSKNGSQDLLPPFNDMVIDPETGEVNENDFIISGGRFIEIFKIINATYGSDRLLILDGENFVHDPLPTLIRIENFLGVSPFFERRHFVNNPGTGFYCANVMERPHYRCANPKIKGRPHPTVDDDVLKKLYEYYRPYNLEMAKEANLNFTWLKEL